LKRIYKIWNVVKDTVSPLPDPKVEVNRRYWTSPLPNISGHQVELVVTMVIEEAKVSRGFGLFIRPADLDHEILFWLTFVNFYQGQIVIQKDLPYEKAWKLAMDVIHKEFDEAKLYYFEQIKNSKPKIVNANTAYNVHLEATAATILRALYDDNFPLI
jgi:hypothetical protein